MWRRYAKDPWRGPLDVSLWFVYSEKAVFYFVYAGPLYSLVTFHHVVRGWNSALHIHPLSHFSGLVLCAFEVAPKHLKMNIPGKGHKPARVRVTLPTSIQANVSERKPWFHGWNIYYFSLELNELFFTEATHGFRVFPEQSCFLSVSVWWCEVVLVKEEWPT